MARVVALTRVSTNRQAESGLGLEGQRLAIADYARRSGFEIVEEFIEDGVSGGAEFADRPVLLDALAAVKAHGAAHLIVSCHDRLARSVLTFELIKAELARVGATLISADGSGNENTAEARLIATILAAVAEFDRAKVAMRVRAAARAKRARGERLGPKPFGSSTGEAIALARCKQLAADGLSQSQIAQALSDEGYRSRRGKRIDQSWVSRRLGQRVSQTP
jgi:DNA invertase Pin-like site-specific DNA recombinase